MSTDSNAAGRATRNGLLVLEDGSVFPGRLIGHQEKVALGEVVFTTSLAGYQEILTDPSYAGQIITMTAPLIGNYGVTPLDDQAAKPWAAGLVLRELSGRYSNWRADDSLEAYLRRHRITCIDEVDTRRLTRHIRSEGAMRAGIGVEEFGEGEILRQVLEHPPMQGLNLARVVTTSEVYEVSAEGDARFRVGVYDFGVKRRSLELLAERGCHMTVHPADTPADDVLSNGVDGVFLSNGPGDPEAVPGVPELIGAFAAQEIPIFGICLGHQLVSRGFGAETFKLLYGHRGGNHPVRALGSGRVEITSQNHGFAVRCDGDSVTGAPDLAATHINLNDQTLEGVRHTRLPIVAVQYHPESAPGPHDSRYLFDEFVEMMKKRSRPT